MQISAAPDRAAVRRRRGVWNRNLTTDWVRLGALSARVKARHRRDVLQGLLCLFPEFA